MSAFLEAFNETVLPHMQGISGYQGSYLLSAETGDQIGLQVLTLWDSPAAIRRFSGTESLAAVVSPVVAALLLEYDRTVRHHTVLVDTVTEHRGIGRGDLV
jgi:heme-degrading monooxygenase HmoA